MSQQHGLSFSGLLVAINTYFSTLLRKISEKIPGFLKKELFGIPYLVLAGLLFAALFGQLRCWGEHFPFTDQQYYLFGGEQILKGKIPYVDFWDCKPVGLFLLYALIQLFSPYQYYALPIISSLFLFAGALGLYKIARFFSGLFPAFLASLSFILIYVSARAIEDGQAEQFFMPIVVWAMALFFFQWKKVEHSLKSVFFSGCVSMLLFGMAMEIKPSCLFEGILAGICFLSFIFLNKNLSIGKRFVFALFFGLVWVFLALLPTLLTAVWYAEHHYLADWIFANTQLNAKRMRDFEGYSAKMLHKQNLLQTGAFFVLLLASSLFLFWRKKVEYPFVKYLIPYGFIVCWLGITLISSAFLRAGSGNQHYLMVTIPSLLLFLLIFSRESIFLKLSLFCVFTVSFILILAHILSFSSNDRMEKYKPLFQVMDQQPGCLYQLVGAGNFFYSQVKSSSNCLPTKYLFGDHLFNPQYRLALPINPEVELRRIFSERPLYLALPIAPEDLENCADRTEACLNQDNETLWTRHTLPEREWQLFEDVLKDYTPLFEYGYWGVYKLKAGLMPKIFPSDIPPEPSRPAIFPLVHHLLNKRLQELKKEVESWPEN